MDNLDNHVLTDCDGLRAIKGALNALLWTGGVLLVAGIWWVTR